MEKNYNHNLYEDRIYSLWEKLDTFSPKSFNKGAETFTIIMPPPNANDPLHIGHAMFVTIEDIMVRHNRMLGKETLWLPGTDHAGIETQYVFEKKLAKEDKSRFDFDRTTLYNMIWKYVQENSGVAITQMKKLGASADWNRFKFTLDPDVVEFVTSTFIKLYNDKQIYRGERLINFCTKCGTGYSELEVEYVERQDPLYYMKYGPFTIATARPETKFRDTALAVNPKDPKYKKFIGRTFDIVGLLGPVNMTVIPDPEVDPKFGTGIMKVTPAHDMHDFELGKKFNLPVTPIITQEGRMDFSWYVARSNPKYDGRAKEYHGMKVAPARELMIKHLKEDGLLIKTDENYSHRIATCYRCHNVLEPLPLPQFFIRVGPLAKNALKALDKKETVVLGAGREKILRNWLKNLKDWNISRRIIWGIRIPVWYNVRNHTQRVVVSFLDNSGKQKRGVLRQLIENGITFDHIKKNLQQIIVPIYEATGNNIPFRVSLSEPKEEGDWLQETDTFDTWFSSGQWPVVTLLTGKKGDFEKFYPTSVMETGYDILPFWVMRMMLLGIYLTGKSPFKTVYLHGLIRDEQGRKMSKSIGNVINPLDMVEKYGADALRMALAMNSTPGTDKNVGEATIRGMRNFSNKIWNATRFVQNMSSDIKEGPKDDGVVKSLNSCIVRSTEMLNKFKIGQAADLTYSFFWHIFCDQYIELAKKGEISKKAMVHTLIMCLKLLHPFMPFVTETLWEKIKTLRQKRGQLLITSSWPTVN